MSVALKKVDGVQDVKVSLEEGNADVTLKDGNKVTLEEVRDVIRKNGFTPKDARVTVRGKVIERDGKPALQVTGLDLVYRLEGQTAKLGAMMGKEVVVSGEVPETSGKKAPGVLLVKAIPSAGSTRG